MVEGTSEQSVSWVHDRDQVAAELRYVTRHHDWSPSEDVLATIIDWHIEAVTTANHKMWVPGMARCNDPVVHEVLTRYYGQQIRAEMAQLLQENTGLKKQLLEVLRCIRFYATGQTDNGLRAKAALEPLLAAGLRTLKPEVIRMERRDGT